MRQEIELRVILEAEVEKELNPQVVADRVQKALKHWADNSEIGFFGDTGWTEYIQVEPIKR